MSRDNKVHSWLYRSDYKWCIQWLLLPYLMLSSVYLNHLLLCALPQWQEANTLTASREQSGGGGADRSYVPPCGAPGDIVCFQTCGELWRGGNICWPRAGATVMDGQVCYHDECVLARVSRSGTQQDTHSARASPWMMHRRQKTTSALVPSQVCASCC